jgi:hypothetical protein
MSEFLLFYVPLKNILWGDVTITGEGLQNLDLCSALRAFTTPAVTRDLGFSGLIRRTAHSVAFYETQGDVEYLYSNPDPHGVYKFKWKAIIQNQNLITKSIEWEWTNTWLHLDELQIIYSSALNCWYEYRYMQKIDMYSENTSLTREKLIGLRPTSIIVQLFSPSYIHTCITLIQAIRTFLSYLRMQDRAFSHTY